MPTNKKNRFKKSKAQSKLSPVESILYLENARAKLLKGRSIFEVIQERDAIAQLIAAFNDLDLATVGGDLIQETKRSLSGMNIDNLDQQLQNHPILSAMKGVLTSAEDLKEHLRYLDHLLWVLTQFNFNIGLLKLQTRGGGDDASGPPNGGGTGMAV